MLLDCIKTSHYEGVKKLFVIAILSCLASYSYAVEFVAGQHYRKLPESMANHVEVLKLQAQDPNKIQIISFFSYGCYWCWQLNSVMSTWVVTAKPSAVSYYRIPVSFNRGWGVLAKAYYLADTLGKLQELDNDLFAAAHSRKNNIARQKNLLQFFVNKGIAADAVNSLYNSFGVQRQENFSNALVRAYRIIETPVVIVNTANNSYLTNIEMAGNINMLSKVLEFLIDKEKSAVKINKNT